MKRTAFMILLALQAACASHDPALIGTGPPGLNIAQAALSGGSPDIALNVNKDILAKDPYNVPALVSQGDAFSELGRLPEAEASYGKALLADPKSVAGQIGLGRLHLRSDPARAEALFLDALQHDPVNTVALNDLGIAYDLQGQHDSAQSSYRKALGADPTMRAAAVNLALSMALNGKAPEAVQLLKPLANDPGASRRVRDDFAAALAISGDKAAATRILSADMTPEQIDQALLAYGKFGP
jgi:tetratricopeptide (TPR) repeat protein